MTIPVTDPRSADCPRCEAKRGQWCSTPAGVFAHKPHMRRIKAARLAMAVQAHADPALDPWFPRAGPCGLCGVPGLLSRHRVVDAIAGRLAAGEEPEDLAGDYRVSVDAARAVAAWAAKWPGAWQ